MTHMWSAYRENEEHRMAKEFMTETIALMAVITFLVWMFWF